MAISGGDGSIILTTDIDESGLKKGTRNLKSEAAKLAAQYRKAGLSQSEAFKKAWSEIERTKKETKETTQATKQFGKQSVKTGKQVKSSMSGITNVIKGIATKLIALVGIYELINFGKQAVQLASDLQEVQNVVDVAFGDMAYRMEEFADTAIETFGISELTAKQTGSSFMAMAKGMQFADDVAADMALTLTGLSADMASFYNIRQEEAKTALSAVYTGETETLKRYGILITEVNLQEFARQQGITKSINAMTQQEKVMLRYQYILQATQLAQGDFVRTQDSWANQTRILSERWKEMATIFGEAFMAIGLLVLPVINSIIVGLTKVAEAARVVAQWIYKAFTGKELKTTQSQGTALSGVGVGANEAAVGMSELGKATGKANKEAKKALAGFDDLQILTSNIADSAGNAGGALGGIGGIGDVGNNLSFEETGGFEKEEEFSFLQQRLEELKTAFGGIKDIDLTNLSNSLGMLKQPLEDLAKIGWDILLWGIENVIVPLTKFTIEEYLPRWFQSLTTSLSILKTVLSKGNKIFQDFYNDFLKPIAKYSADKFLELWDVLNEKLKEFEEVLSNSTAWQDLQTILVPIYQVLEPLVKFLIDFIVWDMKWKLNAGWALIGVLLLDIENALGLIAGMIEGDFDKQWGHLLGLLTKQKPEEAKKTWDEFWTAIDTAFQTGWNNITTWWQTSGLVLWMEDDVKPWFTEEKWSGMWADVKQWWEDGWENIFNWWEESAISTWFEDGGAIAKWFTWDSWKTLWGDLSQWFKDGFSNIKTWLQEETFKKWFAKDGIVGKWFTWDAWKELFDGLFDAFEQGFTNAMNGAIDILNKGINKINELLTFSWDKIEIAGKTIVPAGSIDLGNLPNIPTLAQGAVIPPNREFLAVLGDQKHGTNIEAPLQTIVDAFNIALQGNANYGGGNTEVVLEIDGREFGRAVVEQGNRENRRIGTRLVIA